MPTIFTNPLEALTAADVQGVIGWPESLTVEYKGDLSGKDGRQDAWYRGNEVEPFARDKLFKEIIALANTSGGHLLLGVTETKGGTPPTAAEITPLPRCADLAERLSRAAQQIDPPIPLLIVAPVPTNGEAGIVVFRVPASRAAPHRGLDRECYVRRGSSSVRVGMREIQDMTLAAGRRSDRIDARFAKASTHLRTFTTNIEEFVGFRITAVPITTSLELGRLYGKPGLISWRSEFNILSEDQEVRISVPRLPNIERAIIRGVRYIYQSAERIPAYIELHSDGTVDSGLIESPRDDGRLRLYLGWVLTNLINIMRTVNILRNSAGVPESEYAIEIELIAQSRNSTLELMGLGRDATSLGEGLRNLPIVMPRMSFGPMSELDSVISAVATDLHDATADYHPEPVQLHLPR